MCIGVEYADSTGRRTRTRSRFDYWFLQQAIINREWADRSSHVAAVARQVELAIFDDYLDEFEVNISILSCGWGYDAYFGER